jgi:hypothetical protein
MLEFLSEYEAFSTPSFYNHCDALRRYINDQLSCDELSEWTIALISRKENVDLPVIYIAKLPIPLVHRASKTNTLSDRFQTQAVVGSADESVDLDKYEYEEAMKNTLALPNPSGVALKSPRREEVRKVRPPKRGLLLLYLIRNEQSDNPNDFIPSVAISFPESAFAKPLSYTVNEIWKELYGLVGDWDEDGENK